MLEDLPEPSPLANPLPDLVRAEDRAAFAAEHDLSYRDGMVRVQIELEPGGERPDEYLQDPQQYQNTVDAYVDVDDLVALATDESVRIVRPRSEPMPPGSTGGR